MIWSMASRRLNMAVYSCVWLMEMLEFIYTSYKGKLWIVYEFGLWHFYVMNGIWCIVLFAFSILILMFFGYNNILYRRSTKNKLKRGEKWVNGVSDPTPGAPRFLHFGGHWPKNFHFLHEIKRISCFFFWKLRGCRPNRGPNIV